MLNFQDDLDRRGFGFWAVEVRASGEFIGFTGLGILDDEMPVAGGVEITWRLSRPAWATAMPPRPRWPRWATVSASWGCRRSSPSPWPRTGARGR